MNYKLISFNIIDDKYKLYNNNGYPLLFYWNDEDKLTDVLKDNENLKNKILNIINDNKDIYGTLKFNGYSFYIDENDEEIYDTIEYYIQDIYLLGDDAQSKIIKNKFIVDILNNLYKITFGKDYKFNDFLFESSIYDIYKDLKEKHNDKININTILNYIKSELINTYFLNDKNCKTIIDYVNKILTKKI